MSAGAPPPPSPEAPWSGPDPSFAVLGARAVRHAAAPMIALDLQVEEATGREVYMIALRIQVMLEPARRRYDEATRERLRELFGPPERWAMTTRPLLWTALDVLVRPFSRRTVVEVPLALSFDLELAAARYLHALPDGAAPLALHFNGTIYYRGEDDRMQIVLVPWNKSIDFSFPVAVWREAIEQHYPGMAWLAVHSATFDALAREKLARGAATIEETLRALLDEHRIKRGVEAPVVRGACASVPGQGSDASVARGRLSVEGSLP